MKTEAKPLEKTYAQCVAEGFIKPKDKVDIPLITSLLTLAEEGILRLRKLSDIWEKESKNYAFLLREHYEILRMLIDACLYFDKISISNHQCSNAYLCMKHPDLEFDWEILETMRILRNAVNYEGKRIDSEQWSKLKLQFEVYTNTLRRMVEDKLKE